MKVAAEVVENGLTVRRRQPIAGRVRKVECARDPTCRFFCALGEVDPEQFRTPEFLGAIGNIREFFDFVAVEKDRAAHRSIPQL
jgi:hypothetical protein